MINSFILNGEHTNLNFNLVPSSSELIFSDNEGNIWNIFGKAIKGPRTGEELILSKSVISFWFAIAAFYPNPKIFED